MSLPARAVRFAVDRLLLMDEVRARIFWSDGALGSASGGMGADFCNDELTLYPDDCKSDDWASCRWAH